MAISTGAKIQPGHFGGGKQFAKLLAQNLWARGGFPYQPGRSQPSYSWLPIARGLDEHDISGTMLLTWAATVALWVLDGE